MADSGVLIPKPTDVFVSPLYKLHPADVQTGIDVFDKWLIDISGGWINVERLKDVAAGTPLIGNIFAAVDALLDIKAMIEHRDKSPELFDWLNLALDLIGVVPLPPVTAELRMGARPVLKLLRQEIERSGRAAAESTALVVRDAVISAIAGDIYSRYAGEIDTFIKVIRQGLSQLLQQCAQFIGTLLEGIADLFAVVAGNKTLNTEGNLHAADLHAAQIKSGLASYDASKVMHGLAHYVADWTKIEGKGLVSSAAAAGHAADSLTGGRLMGQQSERLMRMSDELRQRIPQVQKRIRELDGNEVGKIGWLLLTIEQGIVQWRKRHRVERATGVPSHGQAKLEEHRADGPKEALTHTEPAEHPGGSECKNRCPIETPPARSVGSIGFALGDERIEHHDFTIDGPMPVVWLRTYRSFFDANDEHGELGARWITPYMTRFDIHATKLVYHDPQGRSLDYPLLAAGEAHDDRAEELTLLRLDERWLTLTRGNQLLETYEKHGDALRLAFIRDRAGNQVTLDYDYQNRLSRIITGQSQVCCKYDKLNRIIAISQHALDGERLATLAQYRYDEHNDLVAATDRFGNKWHYAYRHHLVTRYTDRTGRAMNLEWNGTGPKAKCVREYGDDGSHEIRLAWHPNFRRVDVTDALGNVTQHHYDRKGYSFRVVHPDGSEEWMDRDAHDNLTQYIHRDGCIERLAYDTRGNLVRHQRTDGGIVEMAYDEKDQVIRMADARGNVWHREYDDKGNLTVETDPLGHKTQFSYDERGLVTQIKDAKGGTKVLAYNDAGALTRYMDCSGRTTKWTYDTSGRLLETTDADGGTTTIQYGANGYPTRICSPESAEELTYDAEGRLLSRIDALGRTIRYRYDAAGRIASRADALGYTLSYRYDRLGRLSTLTDANEARYRFNYDPVGRLVEEIGFDEKPTRYSYDEASGRLQSIDEAGQLTRLSYDNAGRLTKRTSGDEEERFAYDANGRLIDAKNGHSQVQRFFDPAGRLVREHHSYRLFGESRSYVWHHEYDELGNRIKTIRPDGHAVDWLLYGAGHVHGMLLDGVERMQFERDNLHRETLRMLPSRVAQRTTYDRSGRIARRTVQREKAPLPFAKRGYEYDAIGQLTRIDDADKGYTDYRYDPLGRLIEAIGPVARERFAFDPASNIVDAPAPEGTRLRPLATREESSQVPQVPKVLGNLLKAYAGTSFAYDARGNLVRKQSPTGQQRYEWDAFNRLQAVTVEETSRRCEARYFYDPLGRRIAKEVNGERTVFGWDGDTLAYESNERGSTHYLYEPGSFVPLAQYVTASVAGTATPVRKENDRYVPEEDPLQRVPERVADAHMFYYHCDQIGTPLLMTDDASEVVWEASYKAWGETQKVIERASRAAGITPRNPIRFQGQQYDPETGLHYNRHRYYDPQL